MRPLVVNGVDAEENIVLSSYVTDQRVANEMIVRAVRAGRIKEGTVATVFATIIPPEEK